jgi:hypothetical protein
MQLTTVCLIGGGLLLVLGLADVSGSVFIGGLFIVLSVGLYATRPSASVGPIVGVDIDSILNIVWIAPTVAAIPLFLEPGATPAEMQALGGIVGLVGMTNYFLRPIYIFISGFIDSDVPEPPGE